MMNELEIANFVTLIDSINLMSLGPDNDEDEGINKLTL